MSVIKYQITAQVSLKAEGTEYLFRELNQEVAAQSDSHLKELFFNLRIKIYNQTKKECEIRNVKVIKVMGEKFRIITHIFIGNQDMTNNFLITQETDIVVFDWLSQLYGKLEAAAKEMNKENFKTIIHVRIIPVDEQDLTSSKF